MAHLVVQEEPLRFWPFIRRVHVLRLLGPLSRQPHLLIGRVPPSMLSRADQSREGLSGRMPEPTEEYRAVIL